MKVKEQVITNRYALYNGDAQDVMAGMPENSIHYSIFSPPFESLYVYSDSERDLGNCKDHDEFFEHFGYMIKELYRIMMPGRLVSVHCMDIPAMKERDGYIGIKDFPGDIIRAFQQRGFIYHSRVVIWKDPLIEATRTKALGLLHKQIVKDSSMCRNGLPDYLVTFRKPGVNPEPIAHEDGFTEFYGDDEPAAEKIKRPQIDPQKYQQKKKYNTTPVYSHQVWRRYASPVWMDINQTNTLQYKSARDEKDERHICPLQLDVINRGIELWSNEGDIVFSPFGGIGSEPYCAIKMGRRGVAVELKPTWYNQMVRNCESAAEEDQQLTIKDVSRGDDETLESIYKNLFGGV